MDARLNTPIDRWWMVRAEGGTLWEYFRLNDIVAAGSATPKVDLTDIRDGVALRKRFEQSLDGSEFIGNHPKHFRMVDFFLLQMQGGDVVVTPSEGTKSVLVRTVDGPYQYHPKDPHGLHLHRRVKWWKSREINIDDLKKDLQHPTDTVFRLESRVVEALRAIIRAEPEHRL